MRDVGYILTSEWISSSFFKPRRLSIISHWRGNMAAFVDNDTSSTDGQNQVVLGSSQNLQIPSLTTPTDRYGFFLSDEFHQFLKVPLETATKRKAKELERTKKWLKMVKYWGSEHILVKTRKMKQRIRKGIPDCLRGYMWYQLSGARQSKARFHDLSQLDIASVNERTLDEIDRDIDRTFPRHELFTETLGHGQVALRQILRMYAVLDPEVGYCQGMAFIAAMFLTYMSEEDAFYCFHSALTRSSAPLRLMYLPKLVETQKTLYVFEKLGELHLGTLWTHLVDQGIHPTMFATEWIMTMFCRGFSFDLVTRVWDVLLNEGSVKIMYRVSLAILKYFTADFLSGSFEDIMALIRDLPHRIDAESVMQVLFYQPALVFINISKHFHFARVTFDAVTYVLYRSSLDPSN